MSRIFLENQIPEGESTEGMILVFNRTPIARSVTVEGHVLGAKEKAWVTSDDPVLLEGINSGVFNASKTQYFKSARVDEAQITLPPPPGLPFLAQPTPAKPAPVKKPNNQNTRKRKSKK